MSWLSDKNKSDQDRNSVPSDVTDVCNPPMLEGAAVGAAADACDRSHKAASAVKFGWIFTGVGAVLAGAGIWLVVGDHSSDAPEPMAKAKGPKFDFLPSLGPNAGSLDDANDVLSPHDPVARRLRGDGEGMREGGRGEPGFRLLPSFPACALLSRARSVFQRPRMSRSA